MMVLVIGTAGSSPAADDLIVGGSPFVTAPSGSGSTAFIAFAFQDRICRDPLSAAEALSLSGSCDGGWAQFIADLAALPGARRVRVVDHRGAPFIGGTVTVSIQGNPLEYATLGNGSDGDTGIDVGATQVATVALTSAANPIVAAVDKQNGVFEGTGVTLAAGQRLVQVLDAADWLAAPDAQVKDVSRWNPNSFMEPLQEGNTYFAHLVDDMQKAKSGDAVQLAGWAFVKGSLSDDTVDWPLKPGEETTTLINLITALKATGVDVRMLVNQFMQIDSSSFDDFPELLPIAWTFFASLMPMKALGVMQTDPAGYLAGLHRGLGLSAVLVSSLTFDLVKKKLEFSQPLMDALQANSALSGVATWTPYPASFSDNALLTPPYQILGHTIDDVSHIGVYHQKYVIIRTQTDGYVGYLGGIDINSDRVDTTLHRAKHPFHDVQMRVNGPAVRDLIASYAQRATYHSAPSRSTLRLRSRPRRPTRTWCRSRARTSGPGASSQTRKFDFAPNGETTPVRTIKSAIENARDFIYIEDQYFTPPDDYVQALLDAADTSRGVRGLMITMPFSTDQPYGQDRRTDVLATLQTAWGTRFSAGTPLRRYLHETPALTTNLGRMYLASGLSQSHTTATFGAYAHLPAPPFWAFIGNELVLVHALAGPPSGSGDAVTQVVEIVRAAGAPSWGAQPVSHPAKTPVLAVQLPSIYVHAKVMIVDDIFLFCGSSNLNRRGLYHDGEIDSFTIPQHLRSDPTNPARILRSRLMAEHLGLTPEMGHALFADPISAIPYFKRTWYEGSRRQPLSFFGSLPPDVPIGPSGSIPGFLLNVLIGSLQATAKPDVWPLAPIRRRATDPNPTCQGAGLPVSVTFFDLLGIDRSVADRAGAARPLWPNDLASLTQGINLSDDSLHDRQQPRQPGRSSPT